MTVQQAKPAKPFWLPELDILRFFAFFWVFSFHGPPSHPEYYIEFGIPDSTAKVLAAFFPGWGVDVFFCLSAYLITELLRRELSRTARVDIAAFLKRRALRIWPLYVFLVLFVYLVVPIVLPSGPINGTALFAFLTFWMNWFVASGAAHHGYLMDELIIVLWSISVEEQFYIAWPFIFAWTRGQSKRFTVVAGALLVIAHATRAWLHISGEPSVDAWWFNTFVRVDSIVYGAAIAMWLQGRRPGYGAATRLLLLLLAVGGFWMSTYFGHRSNLGGWWTYPLSAASCALTLLAVLGARLPDILPVRALAFLGRISYGLYAWHLFGYYLVASFANGVTPSVNWAMAFAVTLLLALASWHVIERPFLGLKQRLSSEPLPYTAPVGSKTGLPVRLLAAGLFTVLLTAALAKPRYSPAAIRYGDALELIGYEFRNPVIERPYSKVEVHVLLRALRPETKAYKLQVDVFDITGRSLEFVPSAEQINTHDLWQGEMGPFAGYVIFEPKVQPPYLAEVLITLIDPDTGTALPVACPGNCSPKLGRLRFMQNQQDFSSWQNAQPVAVVANAVEILQARVPGSASVGGNLGVDVVWRKRAEADGNFVSFVHVMNADGKLVAQSSAPRIVDTYPTNVWGAGEYVSGRVDVNLPADIAAGKYTVRYGMYLLANQERLPLSTAEGTVITDWLLDLGAVTLTRP